MLAVAGGALLLCQCSKPPGYTPVAAPVPVAAPTGPIVEDESRAFAGYAGDAACRSCHAAAFDKWSTSHHGLAERPVRPELDQSAFDPARTFKHGTQTTAVQWLNGAAKVATPGFGGKVETYNVERVIGHDPLRQFLVNGTGGRVHTLEATWDPQKAEWFNVYGNEDRKPGEWGHWTGRGMVWNTMCAGCHNTRVRKNYDASADTFHTTMAQATVSCEACHGPMKAHAANPKAKLQNPKSKDQTLDTCAMCHARRTELTGDFKPGDNFYQYANGNYLKTLHIPADRSSVSTFSLLGDLALQRVTAIVTDPKLAQAPMGSEDRKIADLKALRRELAQVITSCKGGTTAECRILEALAPAS